ncbi:MAG: hypothetical protein M3N13_01495 [Candidatus Eremiobacteraeota bacterium]|nr:hypothetical protein [Candidatus Eremiobacteraeota bacterium]
MTYVPETYSFDNYGRTIGVTLPAGVFSQSVTGFDLDDGLTGMSGLSVQAPTNVTTTLCAFSNVRNEKLPTYKGACNGRFYNGAIFAAQESAIPDNQGIGPVPWTLDARAGMLKSWQGPQESSGNSSSGQFSYDASGRVTGDTEQLDRAWRASDGTMAGNRVYSTGTRTKTYDAENRLRSQQTSPAAGATYPLWGENNPGGYWNDVGQSAAYELQAVDYSADSHPVRFAATRTPDYGVSYAPETLIWLWDGNDVLAQCRYDNTKTQCASYSFSVEGLGAYYPSRSYVAVLDRGLSGQVVSRHDATQFTGMTPVGRNSRNYFFGGVNASAMPGSASPDTAGSGPGGNEIGAGTKIALDGWTLDNNTWQGVRTYDASVGQWNTPDAYAGNVHDPMSQKPYMWNRNNPYAYSDPSGFAYEPACDAACKERGNALGAAIWNFITHDFRTLMSKDASGFEKTIGAVSIGLTVFGGGIGGRIGGTAIESARGVISESQFVRNALSYLGDGAKEASPGRWVSADGMRQVRFGAHEVNSKELHAHFEAYDKPAAQGGRVVENAKVNIVPDAK